MKSFIFLSFLIVLVAARRKPGGGSNNGGSGSSTAAPTGTYNLATLTLNKDHFKKQNADFQEGISQA